MSSRKELDETIAAMFSNPKYTNYLFYAHLLSQCSVKINTDIPAPAGVRFAYDHYDLFINPELFGEFSLVERLAILKHEMLHITNKHVSRAQDRLHKVWNVGTDCAINQLIDPEHLPDCGITPASLGECLGTEIPLLQSAEYYYEMIRTSEGAEGAEGSGGLAPMDSHDLWEESAGDAEMQDDVTKKMLTSAHDNTMASRGTIPSEYQEWLSLVSRPSVVDWRRVLRGIVGNKRCSKRTTIHRRDRRFPERQDLRGKIKDRTFDLLVVVDVSGSMSNEALTEALVEIKHLCKCTSTTAKMIQVDAQAHEPEEVSGNIKGFQRKGCGGTYLCRALDKAKERRVPYQAVVILTDGFLAPDDIARFAELKERVVFLIHGSVQMAEIFNQGKMRSFQLS